MSIFPLQMAWTSSRASEVYTESLLLGLAIKSTQHFFPPWRAPVPYNLLGHMAQAAELLTLQSGSVVDRPCSGLHWKLAASLVFRCIGGTHVEYAASRTRRGLPGCNNLPLALEGVSWYALDQDQMGPLTSLKWILNLLGLPPTPWRSYPKASNVFAT